MDKAYIDQIHAEYVTELERLWEEYRTIFANYPSSSGLGLESITQRESRESLIGGCDLYITKAAGADKKLYKNIETSLEQ